MLARSTPVSGCSTFEGLWPLQRNQRIPRARVDGDGVADALDVLHHPRIVARDVAGVDDQQEVGRREAIDEQIVDEGALRRKQAGILCLADRKLRRVVGRNALDRGEGVLAGDLDLAHVADVEDPGAGPHRRVFVRQAAVLDRHVPAAERNHFCR